MKKIIGLVLVLVIAVSGSVLAAEGDEILQQLDEVMKAEYKYMEEEMILITASGSERTREVTVWNKSADGEDKMMLKFMSPADVEGTGFLMIEDDMWLYLPALGKVKRIAGSSKQGSFMSSDLTFEDMEALGNVGFSFNYEAELVAEDELEGNEVYHLELTPTNEDMGYGKLELLVDKATYLPWQIDYYNQEGEKEKVLKTYDHQQSDDNWTAGRLEMEDLEKGTKTILKVTEVEFPEEIEDRIFTTRALERSDLK